MSDAKRPNKDWDAVLAEWFANQTLSAEALAKRFAVSENALKAKLREWERVVRYLGRLIEPLQARASASVESSGILSEIEKLVRLTNSYLEGLSDPESGFSLADATNRLLLLKRVIDKVVQTIASMPRDEAAALILEELERITAKQINNAEGNDESESA